jgi:hypothetical protein
MSLLLGCRLHSWCAALSQKMKRIQCDICQIVRRLLREALTTSPICDDIDSTDHFLARRPTGIVQLCGGRVDTLRHEMHLHKLATTWTKIPRAYCRICSFRTRTKDKPYRLSRNPSSPPSKTQLYQLCHGLPPVDNVRLDNLLIISE